MEGYLFLNLLGNISSIFSLVFMYIIYRNIKRR